MPNCTATQVPFAKLGRREIDVRFVGGDVTSDGGFLLLRQARAQVWILRCRRQKVGAVIVRNTRRIRFFLASGFPYQAAFRLAAQRFATG